VYLEPHQFQLRCYIYQARSLFAGDSDTSLSDPYCKISFINRSGKTEVIKRTIAPTWDQTIIFESVNIYSSLQEIIIDPPKVFIQVFDHDPYVSTLINLINNNLNIKLLRVVLIF
jgi:dysferlin